MGTTRQVARRAGAGFTLIEVMIVILIVLALGGLVAYNLLDKKEQAEADIAKIDMNTLKSALRQFRFEQNRYPTDEEGLRVLWEKDAMTDEEGLKKWTKLLEKPLPKDRFGNEWGYRQVSEHGDEETYDLWSYGPDRQENTADDIVSWDVTEDGEPVDTDTSGSSPSGGGGG